MQPSVPVHQSAHCWRVMFSREGNMSQAAAINPTLGGKNPATRSCAWVRVDAASRESIATFNPQFAREEEVILHRGYQAQYVVRWGFFQAQKVCPLFAQISKQQIRHGGCSLGVTGEYQRVGSLHTSRVR